MTVIYGRIAKIFASFRKSGSRNTMVTSDFLTEVEMRHVRACAMHPAIIIVTVRSLWTWLCMGRYHVPQNAFLVTLSNPLLTKSFKQWAEQWGSSSLRSLHSAPLAVVLTTNCIYHSPQAVAPNSAHACLPKCVSLNPPMHWTVQCAPRTSNQIKSNLLKHTTDVHAETSVSYTHLTLPTILRV